jgi:serine phosphatase RsbU (regulator of sigma subunit)
MKKEILILFVICTFNVLFSAACSQPPEEGVFVELKDNWEYRKGFEPAWLEPESELQWETVANVKNLDTISEIKDYKGDLTLRVKVPEQINNLIRKREHIALKLEDMADLPRIYFNSAFLGSIGNKEPYKYGCDFIFIKNIPYAAMLNDGNNLSAQDRKKRLAHEYPSIVEKKQNNYIYVILDLTHKVTPHGIRGSIPQLGSAELIYKNYYDNLILDSILCIIYFLIGSYHLLLWIRRRKDYYNLSFGIFVISFGIFLTANTSLSQIFFYDQYILKYRVDQISLMIFTLAIILFMSHFFLNKISRFAKLSIAANCTIIMVDLLASVSIMRLLRKIWFVILGAGCIYMLYIIARKIYEKNKDAYYLGGGILFIILSAIHDVLREQGLTSLPKLTPIAFQAMMVGIALVLANRFMRVHNDMEKLNLNLEKKVDERTEELRAAMEELEASNNSLESAMEELTTMNQQLTIIRDKLWSEMELAKKIQTVLLPIEPNIEGYDIAAYIDPADEVGGDYYDVINIDGRDWLVIGDVSGHGVPAGLIMMMVQTAIHAILYKFPDLNPSELLTIVNNAITENIKKLNDDKYMTINVFACAENGKFYFSGLHQDIFVYRKDKKDVELIETGGIWIGMIHDIAGLNNDRSLELNSGDALLLYTDGITEAWRKNSIRGERDSESDMYSSERLIDFFKDNANRSPNEIIKAIVSSLNEYSCHDDVTLMVIKRL